MSQLQYFLGGNTPHGFYSLYHELSDPHQIRALYILKGGAGCGKSSLMRRLVRHGEAAGISSILIPCSGDPDSLDGVIFPALATAVVDGTAPHVMEAHYAGLVERYVDLSRFYDRRALQPFKTEIMDATREYRAHYKRAYRCLNAAGELRNDRAELVATDAVCQKLAKRAKGIIGREIKPGSFEGGAVSNRFLSAITCRGIVSLWDTVTAQAGRIYELSDSYGLAHHMLAPILSAAQAAGQSAVACLDPMAPDKLAHLILPDLSLAFVTSAPDAPWPHRPFRHLRLDAMIDSDLYHINRPRLRFSRKVSACLADEGIEALSQAKASHDKLESLYNPHVDFTGVYQTADTLAEEILALPS